MTNGNGWAEIPLGELCRLVNGKAFNPSDWTETGLPIIRIQNLNDVSKPFNHWAGSLERQVMVKAGDVLLGWSGTPGTSFGAHIWERQQGVLNQHIFRLDLDETRIAKEWAVPAINHQLEFLIGKAHGGVGLRHVKKAEVESLLIPLPPLAEQKRIAGILKEQLAAVERARGAAEAQLEAAKVLPGAYLRAEFAALTDYKTIRLSEIASRGITYGIVLTGDHCPEGVPTVRGGDIKGFKIDRECLKGVEPHISEQFSRTVLRGDEVLLVIRGYPGNVAVVAPELVECNVAREIAVIPTPSNWSRSYLQYAIASPNVQRRISDKTIGAAQKGINLSDVADLEIPIISLSAQAELADRLSAALDGSDEVMAAIRSEIHSIEAIPAALLRSALQGRL
ncbi:MAG: restriction endonuclease subunit S [Planctomycetes bacterium]|nr:restriction endonuclease subunit S [Planctomycetota bacterium]